MLFFGTSFLAVITFVLSGFLVVDIFSLAATFLTGVLAVTFAGVFDGVFTVIFLGIKEVALLAVEIFVALGIVLVIEGSFVCFQDALETKLFFSSGENAIF